MLIDGVAFVPSLSGLIGGLVELSAITAEGALNEEQILVKSAVQGRGSAAEGTSFEDIGTHGR